MSLPFSKYHGLGNDFVCVDARDRADLIDTGLARALCDRHRGVGADGVLVLSGSLSAPVMTVINADGSVPEMCGNGLRCFATWLADRFEVAGGQLGVQTGAGPLSCDLLRDARGRVRAVRVAMGRPRLDPAEVPVRADAPVVDAPFEVLGHRLQLTAVGTGNPHAVCFEGQRGAPLLSEVDRLALGPALGAHPSFPAGVNVEFCRVLPGTHGRPQALEVRVYERGCGWTQACGTGATAAAFAAVQLGVMPAGQPIEVRLPGGSLMIEVGADGNTTMTGPAVHVFDGVWPGPAGASGGRH